MTKKSDFARTTRSLRNRVSRVIAHSVQPSPAKPSRGTWVLDFVQARMGTGRTLRIMTVADKTSVFWETAYPRFDHQGFDVVCLLERLCRRRGYPNAIRVDHASEFRSRDLHRWAGDNGIRLEHWSPASQIANPSVGRSLLDGARSGQRGTEPDSLFSLLMREMRAYLRCRS